MAKPPLEQERRHQRPEMVVLRAWPRRARHRPIGAYSALGGDCQWGSGLIWSLSVIAAFQVETAPREAAAPRSRRCRPYNGGPGGRQGSDQDQTRAGRASRAPARRPSLARLDLDLPLLLRRQLLANNDHAGRRVMTRLAEPARQRHGILVPGEQPYTWLSTCTEYRWRSHVPSRYGFFGHGCCFRPRGGNVIPPLPGHAGRRGSCR